MTPGPGAFDPKAPLPRAPVARSTTGDRFVEGLKLYGGRGSVRVQADPRAGVTPAPGGNVAVYSSFAPVNPLGPPVRCSTMAVFWTHPVLLDAFTCDSRVRCATQHTFGATNHELSYATVTPGVGAYPLPVHRSKASHFLMATREAFAKGDPARRPQDPTPGPLLGPDLNSGFAKARVRPALGDTYVVGRGAAAEPLLQLLKSSAGHCNAAAL